MTLQDDRDALRDQLGTHRRTLRIRLEQLAAHSPAQAPTIIFSDIDQARTDITRIKAVLRSVGETIADAPEDTPTDAEQIERQQAGIAQTITGSQNVQAINSHVQVTYQYVSGYLPQDNEPPPIEPPVEVPNLLPMAMNLIGRDKEREEISLRYAAMTQSHHGEFVFLAGQAGYGRRVLLNTIVEDIRGQSGLALHVRFWPTARMNDEAIEALWNDDPLLDPAALAFEAYVERLWPRAARMAGRGWVRLVAQAGFALGAVPTQREMRCNDDPAALKPILRRLARARPVLLAIEGLEHADTLWLDVLRDLAGEIERNLPVLVLTTLQLETPLEQLAKDRYGEAGHFASTLRNEGRGQMWWLGPVSVREIADYIAPGTRDLAVRLHELTGGIPAIVDSLWEAWLESGVIADYADGSWGIAPGQAALIHGDVGDTALAMLRARLPNDPALDEAAIMRILGCAALEGQVFTPQAVARCLGYPADDVLDLLDDSLLDEPDQPGLVAEVGFVDVPGVAPAHRPNAYRFLHPYLWHFWATYGIPKQQRKQLQRDMANALEVTYVGNPDLVAEALIRLFEETGQSKRAQPYRERQDRVRSLEALEWQIHVLQQQQPLSGYDQYRLFGLLIETSRERYNHGQYSQGLLYAQQALDMAILWEDELREALARSVLGTNLVGQGKYRAAQPYHERALKIYELVLGADHPHTATSLNNMGMLLESQRKYGDALPYYERALQIREQTLGPFHADTAMILNNLGALLERQGTYSDALLYYERALALFEQVLGASHPYTATTLNNMGALFLRQRDYEAARSYYERALQIRENALGVMHPDTASSLNNLAVLYATEERFAEAAELMQRTLAICEHVLPERHPNTIQARQSLAAIKQRLQESSSQQDT